MKTTTSLNLSAAIIHLILEGLTNEEIRVTLNLPKAKRYYPSWYRAAMMR